MANKRSRQTSSQRAQRGRQRQQEQQQPPEAASTGAEARPRQTRQTPPAQPSQQAQRIDRARAARGDTASSQRHSTYTQPRRAERRPEIIRQRKEERRRAYERQRRNWLLVRIGIGTVIVLVIAGIAWGAFREVEEFQLRDDVTVYGGINDLSRNHPDGPLSYDVIPPVGGDHNTVWQNCGFYDEPIFNWHGVHSLEHGAVWITYRPDLPQDQIADIEQTAEQSFILASPYPGLKAPVVASVWGRQIELPSATDDRLDAFIREYRRNPDTTPEPQAICSGGTSVTTTEIPQQEPLLPGTPPSSPATTPVTSPVGSPVASPIIGPVATPVGSPVASPAAWRSEARAQG